jgi:membrane protein implicated in regulation of membrane protease activity
MHNERNKSAIYWISKTMKPAVKFTALLACCVVACFFFLSWAMQTIWLASFPGRDTPSAALHFYLQLGAGIAFAVAAVWITWKWLRSQKQNNATK